MLSARSAWFRWSCSNQLESTCSICNFKLEVLIFFLLSHQNSLSFTSQTSDQQDKDRHACTTASITQTLNPLQCPLTFHFYLMWRRTSALTELWLLKGTSKVMLTYAAPISFRSDWGLWTDGCGEALVHIWYAGLWLPVSTLGLSVTWTLPKEAYVLQYTARKNNPTSICAVWTAERSLSLVRAHDNCWWICSQCDSRLRDHKPRKPHTNTKTKINQFCRNTYLRRCLVAARRRRLSWRSARCARGQSASWASRATASSCWAPSGRGTRPPGCSPRPRTRTEICLKRTRDNETDKTWWNTDVLNVVPSAWWSWFLRLNQTRPKKTTVPFSSFLWMWTISKSIKNKSRKSCCVLFQQNLQGSLDSWRSNSHKNWHKIYVWRISLTRHWRAKYEAQSLRTQSKPTKWAKFKFSKPMWHSSHCSQFLSKLLNEWLRANKRTMHNNQN